MREREREGGRVRGTDAIVVWLASRPVRTVNELSLLLLLLLHANLIKSCNKIYGCLLGATLAGPQTSWIFLPAASKGRGGPRACQMPSSQGFRHFASSNICLPHLPAPSPCLRHFFAYMCNLLRLLLWLKTICGLWPFAGRPNVVGIF